MAGLAVIMGKLHTFFHAQAGMVSKITSIHPSQIIPTFGQSKSHQFENLRELETLSLSQASNG